jgi:hypothetical protein
MLIGVKAEVRRQNDLREEVRSKGQKKVKVRGKKVHGGKKDDGTAGGRKA